MSEPKDYGNKYWCVKVPKTISKDGEIYVFANDVVVVEGALLFLRETEGDIWVKNLMLAAGQWTAVYAASVLDGSAVAVEKWAGEIIRT